jgi:transcriptional regulator with XRE-family HTH domain
VYYNKCVNVELKQLRREFKLSQVELASESGVSLPTIQKIESGQANPTLDVMEKIFSVLGLQLQVHCPEVSIDRAIAFGVPLTGKKDPSVILNKNTLRLESRKWIQQWTSGKFNEREEDALIAIFLSLKIHFPDFYQSIESPVIEKALKTKGNDGRIIKLYRIALSNVSLYL